jgi:hypothetical protein
LELFAREGGLYSAFSIFSLSFRSPDAKRRRRIISTGICKSPDNRYSRALHKAALSEIGNSKLPQRIAEAGKAVVLMARELFQAADDNGEEKEALEDAIYALHAFGSNCQMQ